MAELKTKQNNASVEKFLNGVADEKKRNDCLTVLEIMKQVTRSEPKMWGTSIPLAMSMVSGSARGPSYSFNSIKPDIAAPGASVSAEAGTGTGQTAFGGTSGATPMISGSAALLVQGYPTLAPMEIKARLMNTAETNIQINPVAQPGVLAPITRIGGGEVRVNRAFASTTAAWDADDLTPSLSFGYDTVNQPDDVAKTVVVRNYGRNRRTYLIAPSFRYASDGGSAVTIDTRAPLVCPPTGAHRSESG